MPLDAPVYYTPPECGRLLRMKADRIITLIRSGEIRASNVATHLSGRPRFRIAAADLAAWLERRATASVESPRPRRQKRKPEKPAGWISYFGMDR